MEINKKKHQIEAGVLPLIKGYNNTTTTTISNRTSSVNSEDNKRNNLTEWSKVNYPKKESNTPSHYSWFEDKFGIKSYKILGQFTFNIGCAMKYLIRHGRKKSMAMDERAKAIDDLKKAIDFINFEIERLKGE